MFSLRQITAAGFLGVFPGCVLLAVNFERLPYRRGALIGVAFGCLVQFVLLLLYLLTVTITSFSFADPQTTILSTKAVILAVIAVIQTLSAIGCWLMGSYFLYPKSAVTQYDRSELEKRLHSLDTHKRSVVHDLVLSFEANPPHKPRKQSWIHVAALGLVTLSVNVLWLYNINKAFYELWISNMQPQLSWKLDLALDLFWPFLILVAVGYAYLFLSRTNKATAT